MTTANATLPEPVVAAERQATLPLMTEEEFVDWCGDDAWAEWVDGEVILMPAIRPSNGRLVQFVNRLVGGFVDEFELGEVFGEPVQVRLPRQRRRRSPDFLYVSLANADRIEEQQIHGPPDLIVEVVSPESRTRDRREKYAEYQAAGVREYWMADQDLRTWEAYGLGPDGTYVQLVEANGRVCSAVLPGLFFRPEWVWQLRYPKMSVLMPEMAELRAERLRSSPPAGPSDNPDT